MIHTYVLNVFKWIFYSTRCGVLCLFKSHISSIINLIVQSLYCNILGSNLNWKRVNSLGCCSQTDVNADQLMFCLIEGDIMFFFIFANVWNTLEQFNICRSRSCQFFFLLRHNDIVNLNAKVIHVLILCYFLYVCPVILPASLWSVINQSYLPSIHISFTFTSITSR